MKSREAQEQAVVISWCEMQKSKYPELDMIFSIPNGGYRNKIEAIFFDSKFASQDLNVLNSYHLGLAGLVYYNSGCDLQEVLPLYLKKPQAQRQLEERENSNRK